jgi:hypothetical protein
MNYETMKQAGYKYIKFIPDSKEHILEHNGNLEVFISSKNFAGWALIYKNTHLEFCRSYKA